MKEAAYCGTRAIYQDMETSAKSLIATTPVDKVHFIIEDAEFPSELPPIIEVHDLSGQTWFKPDGPNMASQYTWMAMMRIALCHVFDDVEQILSLDADTVFMSDASEFWDYDLSGNYLAACEEWHRTGDNGFQYCNFGVVMYNLAKMRDGKADECIDVLNRRRYRWVEQDVGNYLCQGRILAVPPKWNTNWWTNKNAAGAIIRHYAGDRHEQWWNLPDVLKWRNATWDEVMEQHGR